MPRTQRPIDISKQQQSSDWGADELTRDQKDYAGGDVLYLHQIKAKLDSMLVRESARPSP